MTATTGTCYVLFLEPTPAGPPPPVRLRRLAKYTLRYNLKCLEWREVSAEAKPAILELLGRLPQP